jgi:hypothetical protein
MRWKTRIRPRRIPKNDPRFLTIKALELKGRADKLSEEADRELRQKMMKRKQRPLIEQMEKMR